MQNIIISVPLSSCFQKKHKQTKLILVIDPYISQKIWTFEIKNKQTKTNGNAWKLDDKFIKTFKILTFGTIWLLSLSRISKEVDEIRQHVDTRSHQIFQRQKPYENWEQNENDVYILNIWNFWIWDHVDLFLK